jgi:hypothetical protein
MLSNQQFGGLSGELRRSGGFSVNVETGERPTSGIMVSDPGGEEQRPLRQTRGPDIKAYAQAHAEHLKGGNRFLGGWKEGRTAYLDRSTRYPAEGLGASHAYLAMVGNRQKAAYNVGTGQEISNPARQGRYDVDEMTSIRRMRGENVP